jgi:Tfp pilus assembly PilM family ATPase
MSQQPHLVYVSDGAWRLGVAPASGPVATAAGATFEARAATIKEHVAALGDLGSSVILALPSAWCLSATVSTDGLDRSSRRRAMGFRIEEQLPIAAEDAAVDFVMADDDTAMGVCAEFAKLEAIVAEHTATWTPS